MALKTFETIIILDELLTEEECKKVSYHFKNVLNDLLAVKIKTERLGKKRLAYEIKYCSQGWLITFKYLSTTDLIHTKLDPILRNDDRVIKFVTVLRKDDEDIDYEPDPDEDINKENEQKTPIDIFDLIFDTE